MADNRLTVAEREQFLAEPHIAAFSVAAGPDRGPLVVPIWYQYEPGGEAWILTEAKSRKVALIEAAGRFSLMVDRVTPTTRYVSVEGPVTRTIRGTDELRREMAERYLSAKQAEAYLEMAQAEFGEEIAIYMRPQRWLASDLGPG
jgi:nitroimidazol reductase NimA-like FMN-containing flavoprotein (pyridoxamine 5'-phosphate oxidase superfamily)